MHFLWWWMYSIGSSMVMMWHWRVWLILSIIAASVVDLPLPVGPVTRTRPFVRLGELARHRRQPQLVERQDLERDLPDHHADHAALQEDVGAEARQALDAEGEVQLLVGLEALLLLVGQHAVGELQGVARG